MKEKFNNLVTAFDDIAKLKLLSFQKGSYLNYLSTETITLFGIDSQSQIKNLLSSPLLNIQKTLTLFLNHIHKTQLNLSNYKLQTFIGEDEKDRLNIRFKDEMLAFIPSLAKLNQAFKDYQTSIIEEIAAEDKSVSNVLKEMAGSQVSDYCNSSEKAAAIHRKNHENYYAPSLSSVSLFSSSSMSQSSTTSSTQEPSCHF